jgi:hypothetical protein
VNKGRILHPAIKVIMVIIDAGSRCDRDENETKGDSDRSERVVFSQIGLRPKLSSAQNVESILNDCRTVDRLQCYCANNMRPTCTRRRTFSHALPPLMKE